MSLEFYYSVAAVTSEHSLAAQPSVLSIQLVGSFLFWLGFLSCSNQELLFSNMFSLYLSTTNSGNDKERKIRNEKKNNNLDNDYTWIFKIQFCDYNCFFFPFIKITCFGFWLVITRSLYCITALILENINWLSQFGLRSHRLSLFWHQIKQQNVIVTWIYIKITTSTSSCFIFSLFCQ